MPRRKKNNTKHTTRKQEPLAKKRTKTTVNTTSTGEYRDDANNQYVVSVEETLSILGIAEKMIKANNEEKTVRGEPEQETITKKTSPENRRVTGRKKRKNTTKTTIQKQKTPRNNKNKATTNKNRLLSLRKLIDETVNADMPHPLSTEYQEYIEKKNKEEPAKPPITWITQKILPAIPVLAGEEKNNPYHNALLITTTPPQHTNKHVTKLLKTLQIRKNNEEEENRKLLTKTFSTKIDPKTVFSGISSANTDLRIIPLKIESDGERPLHIVNTQRTKQYFEDNYWIIEDMCTRETSGCNIDAFIVATPSETDYYEEYLLKRHSARKTPITLAEGVTYTTWEGLTETMQEIISGNNYYNTITLFQGHVKKKRYQPPDYLVPTTNKWGLRIELLTSEKPPKKPQNTNGKNKETTSQPKDHSISNPDQEINEEKITNTIRKEIINGENSEAPEWTLLVHTNYSQHTNTRTITTGFLDNSYNTIITTKNTGINACNSIECRHPFVKTRIPTKIVLSEEKIAKTIQNIEQIIAQTIENKSIENKQGQEKTLTSQWVEKTGERKKGKTTKERVFPPKIPIYTVWTYYVATTDHLHWLERIVRKKQLQLQQYIENTEILEQINNNLQTQPTQHNHAYENNTNTDQETDEQTTEIINILESLKKYFETTKEISTITPQEARTTEKNLLKTPTHTYKKYDILVPLDIIDLSKNTKKRLRKKKQEKTMKNTGKEAIIRLVGDDKNTREELAFPYEKTVEYWYEKNLKNAFHTDYWGDANRTIQVAIQPVKIKKPVITHNKTQEPNISPNNTTTQHANTMDEGENEVKKSLMLVVHGLHGKGTTYKLRLPTENTEKPVIDTPLALMDATMREILIKHYATQTPAILKYVTSATTLYMTTYASKKLLEETIVKQALEITSKTSKHMPNHYYLEEKQPVEEIRQHVKTALNNLITILTGTEPRAEENTSRKKKQQTPVEILGNYVINGVLTVEQVPRKHLKKYASNPLNMFIKTPTAKITTNTEHDPEEKTTTTNTQQANNTDQKTAKEPNTTIAKVTARDTGKVKKKGYKNIRIDTTESIIDNKKYAEPTSIGDAQEMLEEHFSNKLRELSRLVKTIMTNAEELLENTFTVESKTFTEIRKSTRENVLSEITQLMDADKILTSKEPLHKENFYTAVTKTINTSIHILDAVLNAMLRMNGLTNIETATILGMNRRQTAILNSITRKALIMASKNRLQTNAIKQLIETIIKTTTTLKIINKKHQETILKNKDKISPQTAEKIMKNMENINNSITHALQTYVNTIITLVSNTLVSTPAILTNIYVENQQQEKKPITQ